MNLLVEDRLSKFSKWSLPKDISNIIIELAEPPLHFPHGDISLNQLNPSKIENLPDTMNYYIFKGNDDNNIIIPSLKIKPISMVGSVADIMIPVDPNWVDDMIYDKYPNCATWIQYVDGKAKYMTVDQKIMKDVIIDLS